MDIGSITRAFHSTDTCDVDGVNGPSPLISSSHVEITEMITRSALISAHTV